MKLAELSTPCFVVDIHKVRSNVATMQKNCKQLGVILRAHTKTHKTVEVAEMQTGPQKRGLVVSTLPEAEAYANAGFDDILLGHPITQEKITRCIALIGRLDKFVVMVSDINGLKCLEKNQKLLPKGKRWAVVIEVDTGYSRSGFLWNSEELTSVAGGVLKTMELVGVYCHCGSSYNLTSAYDRQEHHQKVTECLSFIKARIKSKYPTAPDFIVGTGSTPSCSLFADCHRQLDEFHPGNYVFYDMQQYRLNSCRMSDIAGRVMTRVVAHKPEVNQLLVDCGFLGLSLHGMDSLPADYCVFDGENNLQMVGMSQELGKVKARDGDLDVRLYPVGTILFILPYHACATAAMHDSYIVHDGDEVVGRWKTIKGW